MIIKKVVKQYERESLMVHQTGSGKVFLLKVNGETISVAGSYCYTA